LRSHSVEAVQDGRIHIEDQRAVSVSGARNAGCVEVLHQRVGAKSWVSNKKLSAFLNGDGF
jgi:hypothetical protein